MAGESTCHTSTIGSWESLSPFPRDCCCAFGMVGDGRDIII